MSEMVLVRSAAPRRNECSKGEPKTQNPVKLAMACALMDEPEDISTLIEKAQCFQSMTAESVERALSSLITDGMVNTRYGLFFLTSKGRCWVRKIMDVGAEDESCRQQKVPRSRPTCENVMVWGNPAYLEELQWNSRA